MLRAQRAHKLLTTRESSRRDAAGCREFDAVRAADVVHAQALCPNAPPTASPAPLATSNSHPKTTNAPHR